MSMYIYRILLGRQNRNMLQIGLLYFLRIHSGKIEALRRTYAGLPLAHLARNVGRSFWTIGRNGVAESICPIFIDSALRRRRGYSCTDIMFREEEIRKTDPSIIAPHRLAGAGSFGGRKRAECDSQRRLREKIRAMGKRWVAFHTMYCAG